MDGNTLRELAIKVSQYFLDFLESDFKRQQAPRRRIVLQTDGGFRSGMKTAPYRFLRVNRFNLGVDPVGTLSDRLIRLVEGLTVDHNGGSIQNMQDEAEGLTTGELKTCSRCKKIKPLDAFFDKTLKKGEGGLGRVCMTCKDDTATAEAQKRQSGRQRIRSRRWRHWR